MSKNISASIEVSPKQAVESNAIIDLFPHGGRVYLTDIGSETTDYLVRGAKRIRDLGYEPVPHFASRRMIAADILEDRVKRMASEAKVSDVLVIGGSLEKEAGEFSSTMQLLETGVFQRHGITHMGIAGHPEGSPDFDDDTAMEALHQKQDFAEKTGLNLRIVTQFGFDAAKFIDWTQDLTLNQRQVMDGVKDNVRGCIRTGMHCDDIGFMANDTLSTKPLIQTS